METFTQRTKKREEEGGRFYQHLSERLLSDTQSLSPYQRESLLNRLKEQVETLKKKEDFDLSEENEEMVYAHSLEPHVNLLKSCLNKDKKEYR